MKRQYLLIFVFLANAILANVPVVSIIDKLNPDSVRITTAEETMTTLLQKFREKPNLYLCNMAQNINGIKKNFPDEIKKSIQVAEEVKHHTFVYRYDWDMEKTNVPYTFKKEIDWKAIPFGDQEWCFMLNRQRFWIDLGKAYLFTKDESYAKTWVSQLTHWIEHNPVKDYSLRNLSWRRIEAGIRCENWIKSFEYFKNSPAVTPQFLGLFLNSLYDHAEYLNSSFGDFSRTSNWGVLEFQGLFNAALFMPEFKLAPKWKADALNNLSVCARLQILPDGTQWEQSPMYHNEVFHCLMNVCYLSQKFAVALPEDISTKTKAMALANVKWQKPNYHQPLMGDGDDTDLRGLLSAATCVFNDHTLKSRSFQKLDYENSFLFTPTQQSAFEQMKSEVPAFCSIYLQSSGTMVMRNSWSDSAAYLSFQLKKLGCGHAHDDIFNISLFANGRDYLVDGGRYTYVETALRQQLKSSIAHNSLAVDNQPNSIYSGSWSNSYSAQSHGEYTRTTADYDYAEADNLAYNRLPNPVLMTRRVLYIKPGLWLLFDSFNSTGTHKFSQYFHFPDKKIQLSDNRIQTTYDKDNLTIQAINPVSAKVTDSQWSPEYNLLVDNAQVEFYRESKGFGSFITAMYFAGKMPVKLEKTPVFTKENTRCADDVAEALKIHYGQKEYIVLVVYRRDVLSSPFLKVENELLTGNVVLMEMKNGRLFFRFH